MADDPAEGFAAMVTLPLAAMADAYPASEANATRRGAAAPAPDSPPSPTRGSTRQQAMRFKPEVKIRLTALRDVIAVLRSRYMDGIFRLSSVFLLVSLLLVGL